MLKRSIPTDGKDFTGFDKTLEKMAKEHAEWMKNFGGKTVVTDRKPKKEKTDGPFTIGSYTLADLKGINRRVKYKFSSRSLTNMIGVDRRLIDLFAEVANYINITVVSGCRTSEEQHELFLLGRSSKDGFAKKSKHQMGLAIDVVPYIPGIHMYTSDPENDVRWGFFTGFVQAIAAKQGLEIRNGMKWRSDPMDALRRPYKRNSLKDPNHFEIV